MRAWLEDAPTGQHPYPTAAQFILLYVSNPVCSAHPCQRPLENPTCPNSENKPLSRKSGELGPRDASSMAALGKQLAGLASPCTGTEGCCHRLPVSRQGQCSGGWEPAKRHLGPLETTPGREGAPPGPQPPPPWEGTGRGRRTSPRARSSGLMLGLGLVQAGLAPVWWRGRPPGLVL